MKALTVAGALIPSAVLLACSADSTPAGADQNGADGGGSSVDSSSAPPDSAGSSLDGKAPGDDGGGPGADVNVPPGLDSGTHVPPGDGGWAPAPDGGGCVGDDAGVFSLMSDTTPIQWVKASPNNVIGNYRGQGKFVAQVFYAVDQTTGSVTYGANLLNAFDQPNVAIPVAALQGTPTGCDSMTLSGAGWMASIQGGHLTGSDGTDSIDLQRVVPALSMLGAPAPAGAVVLFSGADLSQWGAIDCVGTKDWTTIAGPAQWMLVDGAIEIVPGTCSIITRQTFGDATIHVEFRTIGTPSHTGVFPQAQYQTTILQDYGLFAGNITGNYGNSPDPANPGKGIAVNPQVRAGLPPLEWQTLDIEYKAPTFDSSGNETAKAVETVTLNDIKLFDQLQMDPPGGSAARIYMQASTGAKLPLLLEYHGMPVQFRNIWVVPH